MHLSEGLAQVDGLLADVSGFLLFELDLVFDRAEDHLLVEVLDVFVLDVGGALVADLVELVGL